MSINNSSNVRHHALSDALSQSCSSELTRLDLRVKQSVSWVLILQVTLCTGVLPADVPYGPGCGGV